MNEIMVSVVCNTYNQEGYIRDALESFVMQKTNFPFEILVHDDASTDGTAAIIREFEEKYPDLIKPVYQTENQYSQGISPTRYHQIPRAKGKYIAMCEGDDYWTDPLKLQKQFDAMEQHPEVDICAHSADVVDASTKRALRKIEPCVNNAIIPTQKVILGGGGFFSTNSLMYRKVLHESSYKFYDFLPMDYTLQIMGSLRGGTLYLTDNMSAYRYFAYGSWTQQMAEDREKTLHFYKKLAKMLNLLDEETERRFHNEIEMRILEDELDLQPLELREKELLQKRYRPYFKTLPFKIRLKIRAKVYFPFLKKWKDKRNNTKK